MTSCTTKKEISKILRYVAESRNLFISFFNNYFHNSRKTFFQTCSTLLQVSRGQGCLGHHSFSLICCKSSASTCCSVLPCFSTQRILGSLRNQVSCRLAKCRVSRLISSTARSREISPFIYCTICRYPKLVMERASRATPCASACRVSCSNPAAIIWSTR